jgi:alcohol dehydrogenase YqhD (iron-dependent ADH family)
MRDFTFYNPTKVLFGKNKIEELGANLKKSGVTKVLFLYGKGSIFNNGVYERTAKMLKQNGIDFVELGGVKANPVLSKVREAIELVRAENVKGILAVGGGSVIDSAKAIGAGAMFEGEVWDLFEGKSFFAKSLPIFTILTISATGSEMNPFAVITKEDEKKKWAFTAGNASFPKVTVIEPKIQFSLPPAQTANGAVDAIAHVLELYFDGTENVDIQDEIAEGLIRDIMKHSKILIDEPDNYDSRAELAWCATLALNGINSAGRSGGDWATHTLEHSLSAYYDIAHGAGLAIMFPAWIKYVYQTKPERFIKLARNVFGVEDDNISETINKLTTKLQEYFKSIGAPTHLSDIGVDESEIEKLTENASMRLPVGRLRKLNKDDIREIFRLAL